MLSHIAQWEKLCACLRLSFFSRSATRIVYMSIIMRNFSWLCLLHFSLSFCSALWRPHIVDTCLSISVFFAYSSAFSHIFFIRIVSKTSFSSTFSSITSITSFYLVSCNRANDRKRRRRRRKKKRKEKLSLLLPASPYPFISIPFLPLLLLYTTNKKKPNSCNNYANKNKLA